MDVLRKMDGVEKPNGVAVLISGETLWRDCLARCLEQADYTVQPFPSLAAWADVRGKQPVPSVVLIVEPDHGAMALMQRIASVAPTVVISDVYGNAGVANLLQSGVRGVVPISNMTLGVAVHAVRLVESGGTFVPPHLLATREDRREFGGLLTVRQMDVVEAIRQGKSNKQIAHDLELRESTIKVHIRQIMRKLDAKNRTEIAVLANELLEIGRGLPDGG